MKCAKMEKLGEFCVKQEKLNLNMSSFGIREGLVKEIRKKKFHHTIQFFIGQFFFLTKQDSTYIQYYIDKTGLTKNFFFFLHNNNTNLYRIVRN